MKVITQLSVSGSCDPTETEILSEFTPAFRGMRLPPLDFRTVARSITRTLPGKEVFPKLKKESVLCQHEEGSWLISPLALLDWTQQKWTQKHLGDDDRLALHYHIQQVFHHDTMVGLRREKHLEHVLMNVDAANRLAHWTVGIKTPSLSTLFKGAEMDKNLESSRVRVLPSNISYARTLPTGLVHEVDNFVEAKDEVLQKLSSGFIVRSKRHNEGNVQYLSPLWEAVTGKMIIIGAQVSMRAHSVALRPLCIRVI